MQHDWGRLRAPRGRNHLTDSYAAAICGCHDKQAALAAEQLVGQQRCFGVCKVHGFASPQEHAARKADSCPARNKAAAYLPALKRMILQATVEFQRCCGGSHFLRCGGLSKVLEAIHERVRLVASAFMLGRTRMSMWQPRRNVLQRYSCRVISCASHPNDGHEHGRRSAAHSNDHQPHCWLKTLTWARRA